MHDCCLTISGDFISAPLYSPGNISLRNTSSTSIKVTWYGLDEHVIRGIFYGYEIWFTAHPEFPSAYLRYGMKLKLVVISHLFNILNFVEALYNLKLHSVLVEQSSRNKVSLA